MLFGDIDTEVGDVLILRTRQSYTIYAVGTVSERGQQDFKGHQTVTHVRNRDDAIGAAKSLAVRGGRIYLVDIDTAEWSEIPFP